MSKQTNKTYDWLLDTFTSEKWKRIGIDRRAGVCIPLFSVYSSRSAGIGEFPDLRLAADWCKQSGLSIIQLLPLNDTGQDFSPYNSLSTFAIDPVYLCLSEVKNVNKRRFSSKIGKLKRDFPAAEGRVNYGIKKAKLELLREMFDSVGVDSEEFKAYKESNMHWLRYYALFMTLTGLNGGKGWMQWDLLERYMSPLSMAKLAETHSKELEFHYWVQWQAFEQLRSACNYARKIGVLIMGDLPFLVSKNSADVWAYKNYFKLNLSSGAPPDMYFARGQKWGTPPYDWAHIRADDYNYIRARLRYAESFYDMFRIDHFVGLFRVWTVDAEQPAEKGSENGRFDPPFEELWDAHGREIIKMMCECTTMMPCAEDLGTVPDCSPKALNDFGITGINVQRWEKKTTGFSSFIPAEEYRENSNAVISTHDSSSFPYWYEKEAGTVDRTAFEVLCTAKGISAEEQSRLIGELFLTSDGEENILRWKPAITNVFMLVEIFGMPFEKLQDVGGMYLSSYGEKESFNNYLQHNQKSDKAVVSLIRKNLRKIFEARSIFCIQLISEFLFLDSSLLKKCKYIRYNSPGTVSGQNWSAVIPVSFEELLESGIGKTVRSISESTGRS